MTPEAAPRTAARYAGHTKHDDWWCECGHPYREAEAAPHCDYRCVMSLNHEGPHTVRREAEAAAGTAAAPAEGLPYEVTQAIVDAAFPTGGTTGPNAWTEERIRVRTRFAEELHRILDAALARHESAESEKVCHRCGEPITDRCWRHD